VRANAHGCSLVGSGDCEARPMLDRAHQYFAEGPVMRRAEAPAKGRDFKLRHDLAMGSGSV
jgi:hypothetical protein